nr:MAG TPA: hypothetical protein [Caudoviricetes sp.]
MSDWPAPTRHRAPASTSYHMGRTSSSRPPSTHQAADLTSALP